MLSSAFNKRAIHHLRRSAFVSAGPAFDALKSLVEIVGLDSFDIDVDEPSELTPFTKRDFAFSDTGNDSTHCLTRIMCRLEWRQLDADGSFSTRGKDPLHVQPEGGPITLECQLN